MSSGKQQTTKLDVKFVNLDDRHGERSLKQHGFIAKQRKRKWTLEPYIGNISLCKRVVHGNENEEIEDFDKIEAEPINNNLSTVCKTCLSIYNQRRYESK